MGEQFIAKLAYAAQDNGRAKKSGDLTLTWKAEGRASFKTYHKDEDPRCRLKKGCQVWMEQGDKGVEIVSYNESDLGPQPNVPGGNAPPPPPGNGTAPPPPNGSAPPPSASNGHNGNGKLPALPAVLQPLDHVQDGTRWKAIQEEYEMRRMIARQAVIDSALILADALHMDLEDGEYPDAQAVQDLASTLLIGLFDQRSYFTATSFDPKKAGAWAAKRNGTATSPQN